VSLEIFRTLVRRNLRRLGSSWILLAAAVTYAIFAAFAFAAVRVVGDIESQVPFWCGNLLGSAGFVSTLLGVTLGATLLSADVKTGVIFAYLARPLPRASVFTAAWAAAALVILVFDGIVISICAGLFIANGLGVGLTMILGFLALVLGHLVWLTVCAALASRLAPAIVAVVALGWAVVVGWAFAESLPRWLELGSRTLAAFLPLTELDDRAITEAAVGATQDLGFVTEALGLRLAWVVLLVVLGGRWFSSREITPHV
jgi:ABC-type transport system involved in multi-copper enzyme maturation permease subunit